MRPVAYSAKGQAVGAQTIRIAFSWPGGDPEQEERNFECGQGIYKGDFLVSIVFRQCG